MAARRRGPDPAPAQVITVELAARSYPIVIGSDVLLECGERLATLFRPGRCAVITNPTVSALYAQALQSSLHNAGFEPMLIEIGDGESFKSFTSLQQIYDALITARLDRSAPLLALGGGVIGDLTGFAAATYLRGVPYIQVPTTLLAQVDSSVGGKTGVNHALGKNLIGSFYQPQLVLSDISLLATLPRREIVAGLVEVIKYGATLDRDLFEWLERDIKTLVNLDPLALQHAVRRSCELKAAVVQADEREADYRAVLNFGHTLGHAIESLTGYRRFLHGEAVAIGMAFAARVSAQRGTCSSEDAERIIALLKRAGAPVELPRDLHGAALAAAIAGDKKATGDAVKFVLVQGLGETRFATMTPGEIADLAVRGTASA
jgi:3-dehydroquinate synthase